MTGNTIQQLFRLQYYGFHMKPTLSMVDKTVVEPESIKFIAILRQRRKIAREGIWEIWGSLKNKRS